MRSMQFLLKKLFGEIVFPFDFSYLQDSTIRDSDFAHHYLIEHDKFYLKLNKTEKFRDTVRGGIDTILASTPEDRLFLLSTSSRIKRTLNRFVGQNNIAKLQSIPISDSIQSRFSQIF